MLRQLPESFVRHIRIWFCAVVDCGTAFVGDSSLSLLRFPARLADLNGRSLSGTKLAKVSIDEGGCSLHVCDGFVLILLGNH
jgi:hypothetical protein